MVEVESLGLTTFGGAAAIDNECIGGIRAEEGGEGVGRRLGRRKRGNGEEGGGAGGGGGGGGGGARGVERGALEEEELAALVIMLYYAMLLNEPNTHTHTQHRKTPRQMRESQTWQNAHTSAQKA